MQEIRLIDANVLKDDFCAMKFPTDRINVLELIDKQPTVDAEPVRHGRWIEDECYLKCSACKWEYSDELPFMSNNGIDEISEAFARCPHCGAKLDAYDTNVLTNGGGTGNG